MGTSLHGSIEGRREERPEPRLSESLRSTWEGLRLDMVEMWKEIAMK